MTATRNVLASNLFFYCKAERTQCHGEKNLILSFKWLPKTHLFYCKDLPFEFCLSKGWLISDPTVPLFCVTVVGYRGGSFGWLAGDGFTGGNTTQLGVASGEHNGTDILEFFANNKSTGDECVRVCVRVCVCVSVRACMRVCVLTKFMYVDVNYLNVQFISILYFSFLNFHQSKPYTFRLEEIMFHEFERLT